MLETAHIHSPTGSCHHTTPQVQQVPWSLEAIVALFEKPFFDLLYQAHTVFRKHGTPNHVQLSTLLNIKTGSCPENCSYCPQSAHYDTGLKKEPLMELDTILAAAQQAKNVGATRFCMGAAWRGLHDKDLACMTSIVKEVKGLGLETCMTLGLLKKHQAEALKEAGLDFYNHNIDTSEEFYDKIITTRSFQDRLETLEHVREAGLKVCCGGILGMGETQLDRAKMLMTLANLAEPPESVPINKLIPIPGTPLAEQAPIDSFEFIRTIAVARILMPKSYVRLSAGRESMSDEMQALCFFAGVNSIFYGEKLLTAENPVPERDLSLFARLGLNTISALR